MRKSEQFLMAGIPVGTPGYTPRSDYQQRKCTYCPTVVWVGPRQANWLDDMPDTPLMCPNCAYEKLGPTVANHVQCLEPSGVDREADRRTDVDGHPDGGR